MTTLEQQLLSLHTLAMLRGFSIAHPIPATLFAASCEARNDRPNTAYIRNILKRIAFPPKYDEVSA